MGPTDGIGVGTKRKIPVTAPTRNRVLVIQLVVSHFTESANLPESINPCVTMLQTLHVTFCNTYLAQLFILLLLETHCIFLTLFFQSVCRYNKSTSHHGTLHCKYYTQIFKFVSITAPDNEWPVTSFRRAVVTETQFLLDSITRLCDDFLIHLRAFAYCRRCFPIPSVFANSCSLTPSLRTPMSGGISHSIRNYWNFACHQT